jgi:hypothetical protein
MYCQVVLGSVWMEEAVARLLERYGDSRPERPAARGPAALAVVILDCRGNFVAAPAVSSFAWADRNWEKRGIRARPSGVPERIRLHAHFQEPRSEVILTEEA